MAKWKDVRARAGLDDQRVQLAEQELLRKVVEFQLAELREQEALTQKEVMERMGVSQPRVSQIESANLDRTQLGTVRSYIEALGGHLEVAVQFGDRRQIIA